MRPAMPSSSTNTVAQGRPSRRRYENAALVPSSPMQVPKDVRPEKVWFDQWVAIASSIASKDALVLKIDQAYPSVGLYPSLSLYPKER